MLCLQASAVKKTAKIKRQGSTGMNPLQRAKSELLDVRERFKTRTIRRGRQNRNTQDQMPADARGATDLVVEQANKTTLKDKLRRTFSPRRGELELCSSTVVQACVTCMGLEHMSDLTTCLLPTCVHTNMTMDTDLVGILS